MSSLHALLSSRLENLRPYSGGGWSAACPCCRSEGHDKQGNHLRIFPSSAFRCAKIAKDEKGANPIDHNRFIRAWIYQNADPETLALLDTQIIDPDPKIEADKVYDEAMLKRLVPDHRYWVGRGIKEDVLRKLEGGLSPPDERSKTSDRYLFPIRDPQSGRIHGWTGRLVNEASFGPTHKHLVKVSKAVYPWTVTGSHIKRTRKAILTEGWADGGTFASHDMWNWLLLLGLNMNSRMLGLLISANPTHIIISTNNDAIGKPNSDSAGNKAAIKIRDKLAPFFGEEKLIIDLPQTAKDWNAADSDEVEAFKERVNAL